MYLVDDGAKNYVKDFGGDSKTFSKKNKLESAEVFFEAVGCSFAGHSQLARNLLDDLAEKYGIDHVKI